MILNLMTLLSLPLAYNFASALYVEERLNIQYDPLIVCAYHGCVRGKMMAGYWTHSFEAYLGIPYAWPAIGRARLKDPVLSERWNTILDVTEPKPDCLQKNFFAKNPIITGSEDCLYLNIYVPRGHRYTKRLLPVMVYIHGGGFYSGSAHPNVTGPEYIMDTQQVILVTFNYRLGALGFLSTGDMSMAGNFGLKDQLMALEWVKLNIRDFGGNPEMVTLFGHEAGAVSAHMLMLSKRSEDLFHAVIAMSGTANVPWAIDEDPLATAVRTAKYCDVQSYSNSSALAERLRFLDAETIMDATDDSRYLFSDADIYYYRPIVDVFNKGDVYRKGGIFMDNPEAIMMDGNYKHRPMLLGSVPNEGAVRVIPIMEIEALKKMFNGKFYKNLETFLEFPDYVASSSIDLVIEEYFGNIHQLNAKTQQGFLDDPVLSERWNTILDVTEPKPDCLQKNFFAKNPIITGSEDCLYLNIYVPRGHRYTKRLLPVMVYIHGGGFYSGSAHPNVTGPEYIMDTQQVILVTFNYRLGALGFLSTGDMSMTGNFGLKDQLMALEWVKLNIRDFGGNPEMVTLFGHEAGAVSAHMLMLSKRSEDLFHAVIAMSGTANVPWAIDEDPLATAVRTAKYCDVQSYSNSSALAERLRFLDAETIMDATDDSRYLFSDADIYYYRPIVDVFNKGDVYRKGGIFMDNPEAIMMDGNYKHRPMMLGSVPNEGAVRVIPIMEIEALKKMFNGKFYKNLETFLEFPDYVASSSIDLVIEEYFGNIHQLNAKTQQGFLDLVTDRAFRYPLYQILRSYVNDMDNDNKPVYLYYFNYSGMYSTANFYNGERVAQPINSYYGVVHGDDLIYLFKSALFDPKGKESVHAFAIRTFVDNIVSFATNMKPSIWADTLTPPCNYRIFFNNSQEICEYQQFENVANRHAYYLQQTIAKRFNVTRMEFWDAILA